MNEAEIVELQRRLDRAEAEIHLLRAVLKIPVEAHPNRDVRMHLIAQKFGCTTVQTTYGRYIVRTDGLRVPAAEMLDYIVSMLCAGAAQLPSVEEEK